MPTLADVAERAAVSGKTVSRVVNRDANVSPSTRQKVEDAIAELGFTPNFAARSMASARSYLIGSFIPEIFSYYHAELNRGAARGCRSRNFHLLVEEMNHRTSNAVMQYERCFRGAQWEAIILAPPLCDDAALMDALDRDKIAYVRIAPATDLTRSWSVMAEERVGAAEVARHLWGIGHRRFGVVEGPEGHLATVARRDGFVDTVIALGGQVGDVAVVPMRGSVSPVADGYHAAQELLLSNEAPTAIFAFNDDIAAGVMARVRDENLRIPQDIAVAGFDDSNSATLTWPGLTTVRQPLTLMAQAAVDIIADRLQEAPQTIMFPVELVIRGSTERSRN